ncbi:MAG: class I SAM-dependent methyltransferase [Chloroflexi bacterium]|nr:class I SAM-dependent methyltransferase [Chloroflexota bacterium]
MEELALIRTVNDHFQPFYSYIAEQAMAAFGRVEGDVLEIGPYCPGISLAIAERWPALRIVLGDDRPETNAYFREKIATAGLATRLDVCPVDKFALAFPEGSFDLVVFRGGLFFWGDTAGILREAHRVLRPGGVALVGGGFGAGAPDELIETHLARSRELNRLLNKSRLTSHQVWTALREAGVAGHATLDHRHGLWAVLRRGKGEGGSGKGSEPRP